MNNHEDAPDWAPSDLSDGRARGDWQTKYPDKQARNAITLEAIYIVFLLFIFPIFILLIMSGKPKSWINIDENNYNLLEKYVLAWIGGSLGGTLFDLKWLYHSVAKQLWNIDRRLWRYCTPHISGALSFATIMLISSEFLRIFDLAAIDKPYVTCALGFIIGYFSDTASAKLAQISELLFGLRRS